MGCNEKPMQGDYGRPHNHLERRGRDPPLPISVSSLLGDEFWCEWQDVEVPNRFTSRVLRKRSRSWAPREERTRAAGAIPAQLTISLKGGCVELIMPSVVRISASSVTSTASS